MSVASIEQPETVDGTRPRLDTSLIEEAGRNSQEFDTVIDTILDRDGSKSPNWDSRDIGGQMRFVYVREVKSRAKMFLVDRIRGSKLAFLFNRKGTRGIRRSVYYMEVEDGQRILSETLSVVRASHLPSVLNIDMGKTEEEIAVFTAIVEDLLSLNPNQEEIVARKVKEITEGLKEK